MSDRPIYCHHCGRYLGVIRDAKLRKGITHACGECAVGKNPVDELFRKMGLKGGYNG